VPDKAHLLVVFNAAQSYFEVGVKSTDKRETMPSFQFPGTIWRQRGKSAAAWIPSQSEPTSFIGTIVRICYLEISLRGKILLQ
jgi:hypothetical protein